MTNKSKPLLMFNPSGVGLENGNLYGLPCDYDTAEIIIFGVPWEVTVSYHTGTNQGPLRVLETSPQLDLYDLDNPNAWQQGIFMPPISPFLQELNEQGRKQAQKVIKATEKGLSCQDSPELLEALVMVNDACETMVNWVEEQTTTALEAKKRVGLIGGDHSIPLGYLKALGKRGSEFGILHIDAHGDLREAYQGFRYSHASIMNNVLELPQVSKLVQVGVRDLCHDEVALINSSNGRIITHYDSFLKSNQYQGITWQKQCETIIADLPQQIYVSFDVDGLDPKLCPQTGTPVPGGLELEQVFYLLRYLVQSGRKIIGFDVSEIGNGEWDGTVGARIVYKLCCLMTL
jgi:agmatinase